MTGQPHSAAVEMVRALLGDDHCAEAGETAAWKFISEVVQTRGVEGVAELAAELASKLAEMVEGVATGAGLAAVDLVDLLFVGGMRLRSDGARPPAALTQETPGDADRVGTLQPDQPVGIQADNRARAGAIPRCCARAAHADREIRAKPALMGPPDRERRGRLVVSGRGQP